VFAGCSSAPFIHSCVTTTTYTARLVDFSSLPTSVAFLTPQIQHLLMLTYVNLIGPDFSDKMYELRATVWLPDTLIYTSFFMTKKAVTEIKYIQYSIRTPPSLCLNNSCEKSTNFYPHDIVRAVLATAGWLGGWLAVCHSRYCV